MALVNHLKNNIKKTNNEKICSKSKINDAKVAPDWFQAHDGMKSNIMRAAASERAKQYLSFLWPLATDYRSPLNPVFLVECLNLDLLNTQPLWMVRDGLLPLLWFFKINPTPANFKGRILVHRELTPYVPNSWRAQTGQYFISNIDLSKTEVPGEILVTGLVNEKICNQAELVATLDNVTAVLGQDKLNTMLKTCFLMQRHSPTGADHRHEFFLDYFLSIVKKLNLNNFSSISWSEIEGRKSFENCYLLELNNKSILADNYLVHSVLGRGGHLFPLQNTSTKNHKGNFIQLSPYHGIAFEEKLKGDSMLDLHKKRFSSSNPYFAKFESLMRSEANLGLPWPYWFADWNKISPTHSGERGNA